MCVVCILESDSVKRVFTSCSLHVLVLLFYKIGILSSDMGFRSYGFAVWTGVVSVVSTTF